MLAELTIASWETMARRVGMMAAGSCSAGEYRRMMNEKLRVMHLSGAALLFQHHRGLRAVLAPWHRRARANAKRLRR